MHYIQICRTIFNIHNLLLKLHKPFLLTKKKEIKIKHILKGYHIILSQVMRNGDKGIAADRVTFLELRKIYPNNVDEFICNKKELKTISFNIQWFGKCRLTPFLTV